MEEREIDFLIFEHIFENEHGFIEYLKQQKEELDLNLSIVRRYSTDIKDAFTVWKKLNEKDYYLQIEQESDYSFVVYIYDGYYEETITRSSVGEDKNPALAICKAALKLYGIEI